MNDTTKTIAGGPTPLHRPAFTTKGYTLETAADIVAIQQLLARYSHLLDSDTSDPKQIALLFAPDGEVLPAYEGDAVYKGREAIEKWFANYLFHSRKGSKLRRHLISSIRIEVDGDKGWAFSMLDAQGIQLANNKLAFFIGSYEDDLVRNGDRWFFQRRRVSLDYSWQAPEYTLCRNGKQIWDGAVEK